MITDEQLAEWERKLDEGDWEASSCGADVLGAVTALIAEVRRLRALQEQESGHYVPLVATRVVHSNLSADADAKLRAEIASTGTFSLPVGGSAVVRFAPATPQTHSDAPQDPPPRSRPPQ